MSRSIFGWFAAVVVAVSSAAAQVGSIDFGDHQAGKQLRVGLAADRTSVAPGGQLVLAVVLDHQKGWHAQADPARLNVEGLEPTRITASSQGAASTGPIQWPETHMINAENLYLGVDEIPVFEGRAVAYVPVLVAADAAVGDSVTLTIDLVAQICDDFSCLPPEDVTRTITLPVVSADAAVTPSVDVELFGSFDPATFAEATEWDDAAAAQTLPKGEAAGPQFFGVQIPSPTSPGGLVVVSLLAIVGGFILNLTPCVLPVIPIKIMTLSQHAGSPGKSLALGLWMAAGVVAFWVGIGVPVAFVATFTDPSIIFGFWWITLGIGVLIAAMGVGIMGAFAINLPKQVYMVNPKADTAQGSFMFGVMTAVLGLPCFGFVAGALLAGSATLPPAVVITIFAALGIGMALPYLVLAARPQWVEKIPRTGPASELVKQVMGLLLLAAAAYFIGAGVLALLGVDQIPWWGRVVHWWFVGMFALAAGGWLVVQTVRITPKTTARASMAVVALVLAGGGVAAAANETNHAYNDFWIAFTPERLGNDLGEGKVVVVDFTAEWCLNCKALEAAVLAKGPVKELLLSDGVTALKADLTSKSAPGWETLRELGQTGIPTLAIYAPGSDRPWIANAYTSDQVVAAIRSAAERDG
ncbi:MAG: hypothetical protein CMJ31_05400 [Phycisphaerae bacterium]|nr:hypothetical protein [Phycisphaerae bacterium]